MDLNKSTPTLVPEYTENVDTKLTGKSARS